MKSFPLIKLPNTIDNNNINEIVIIIIIIIQRITNNTLSDSNQSGFRRVYPSSPVASLAASTLLLQDEIPVDSQSLPDESAESLKGR